MFLKYGEIANWKDYEGNLHACGSWKSLRAVCTCLYLLARIKYIYKRSLLLFITEDKHAGLGNMALTSVWLELNLTRCAGIGASTQQRGRCELRLTVLWSPFSRRLIMFCGNTTERMILPSRHQLVINICNTTV